MKKEALCKAFCDEIDVREVPAGLAVKTPFAYSDGDLVGFYITRQGELFRLEDSGLVVPWLESTGVNLQHGTRAEQFAALLQEHEAEFDDEAQEVHSSLIPETQLPAAAVRFVALLLRLQDLQLMRPELVENTFQDDVKRALSERFSKVAKLSFDAPPLDADSDYVADAVIESLSGQKLALYLGTRDARVDEAVMVWMEGQWKHASYQVAVLYENDKNPISKRSYRRAMNRLDSSLIFRGDESGALDRIGRMVGIQAPPVGSVH